MNLLDPMNFLAILRIQNPSDCKILKSTAHPLGHYSGFPSTVLWIHEILAAIDE